MTLQVPSCTGSACKANDMQLQVTQQARARSWPQHARVHRENCSQGRTSTVSSFLEAAGWKCCSRVMPQLPSSSAASSSLNLPRTEQACLPARSRAMATGCSPRSGPVWHAELHEHTLLQTITSCRPQQARGAHTHACAHDHHLIVSLCCYHGSCADFAQAHSQFWLYNTPLCRPITRESVSCHPSGGGYKMPQGGRQRLGRTWPRPHRRSPGART